MKAFWTHEAKADRNAIYAYIETDDINAAMAMDDLFSKAAIQLEQCPMSGRTGRLAGTRELVAHRHYVMIYDISGDTVRILRVLHAARQWPPASSI
jgi:addiction module RelE/StbE family toxin